ncbi:PREDICTED: protein transport protein Sec16B [Galeopterus variegatus]|uniref:Protein transport protein sec16 n=1 Tax=Galeopterus variegatus TaxID=482537 RepID=A0ABM0QNV1_GALVR|nr:PREDICTED: protein transport protein Sec16B [Galeopterus variegatus]
MWHLDFGSLQEERRYSWAGPLEQPAGRWKPSEQVGFLHFGNFRRFSFGVLHYNLRSNLLELMSVGTNDVISVQRLGIVPLQLGKGCLVKISGDKVKVAFLFHVLVSKWPNYEDLYQGYHSPVLREDCAYGSYYYHGHPQWLQEERGPRQGSPYIWHEDYRHQKYLNEHHHGNQNSPFGTNSETQFQSNSQNPYKDSPASNSGQERPRELFPESLLMRAQKNKLSLASESSLLQQHESGLSSSSYELSQYMADAPECYDPMASAAWSPGQAEDVSAAGPKAPMKFYVPHVSVSFGPGGQLVCVCPSSPIEGQIALIELHSMEVILNNSEEQEEMRSFSGPLIREDVHKVDIMMFCQQKAAQSHKSETLRSRDAALLWQLLVLLCRQNGSMVGSDIAELLMQDCKKLEKYKRQTPVANLINLTDEDWPVLSSGTRNLLTGEIPPSVQTPAQIMEKFTKLLYYGRKKLALNDPLQTLFQLMSGRIPQAATCCGDKQWGDWRPHLAVILSNSAGDLELYQHAIVTMGDTLAGRGLVEAAHFCYLMAHVPFGHYTVKTDHLTLLGSSHSQEFLKFATTEAIQRTEIFEYCQMLGRPKSFIPSFQVYKLLYASRLADYGLVSQALHYCEAIAAAVLSQGESSHPVLLAELIKLAEKLKLSDPLILERRRGNKDLEPDWLVKLRRQKEELEQKVEGDSEDPHSARSDISGARGRIAEDTSYQDLVGHQGCSEAPGYGPALWPTTEQTGPTQPSPQQPFLLQLGPYPAGGGAGQTGAPVPLYSVPETHLLGTGGSIAVTGAPGGKVWEETLQTTPVPGENTMSQETFQHPDGQKVISKPQRSGTKNTVFWGEPHSSRVQVEASVVGAGIQAGWHECVNNQRHQCCLPLSTKQETLRASSPSQASPGLSPARPCESPPLPGASTFFRGTGGGEVQGSVSSGGTAEDAGMGGVSDPEGISSELCSSPGVLLSPPPLEGAVPLYNPSQFPQLSTAASLNRPNRLTQRRYPTQPC